MRLYWYHLKNLMNAKDILFWTLAFPIVLGTLFFATFGSVNRDSAFTKIPIGVVWENEGQEGENAFANVLDAMSDGDDALFKVKEYSEETAKDKLLDEKIEAYLLVKSDTDIGLNVKRSSISASIVETFLNEYLAQMDTIQTIVKEHPEQIENAMHVMNDDIKISNGISIKNDEVKEDKYNPFINYFYALIAMTCLFGSMFSQKSIEELQADQSSLGARRNVAPTKKTKLLFVDILAGLTVQMGEILISFGYFAGILKIDFGNNIWYMLLMAFVGSYVGNSMGMFIGTVVKGDANKKGGVLTCVTLTLCFFSGLMYGDMINVVEMHFPILNRINPAALLVNAFHSLAIYTTTTEFYKNVAILMVIGVVMNVISVIVVRRQKYASI